MLVKGRISQLPVYQPGRPIEVVARELGLHPDGIIKLASNENPFGASPLGLAAARRVLAETRLYPDNGGHALCRRLAEEHDWPAAGVTLGAGSNEIFYLLCDLFVEPGVEVVLGAQAFITYKIATLLAGGTPVVVPMPAYRHDLAAMRAAISERTRLVFLPNPNNPTGTLLPMDEVLAFARGLPEHVVLCYDEAYAEYLDAPCRPAELIGSGRVVLTRTFSKIYGLAGLRIGYALSDPELAALLNAVRPPFNTAQVAQAAALAALDDRDWVERSRTGNAAGLRQLEAGLRALGLETVPSAGNFILVRVPRASMVDAALTKAGIIVRPVQGYDLPDHLRISVGTEPWNTRLLAELGRILAAGDPAPAGASGR